MDLLKHAASSAEEADPNRSFRVSAPSGIEGLGLGRPQPLVKGQSLSSLTPGTTNVMHAMDAADLLARAPPPPAMSSPSSSSSESIPRSPPRAQKRRRQVRFSDQNTVAPAPQLNRRKRMRPNSGGGAPDTFDYSYLSDPDKMRANVSSSEEEKEEGEIVEQSDTRDASSGGGSDESGSGSGDSDELESDASDIESLEDGELGGTHPSGFQRMQQGLDSLEQGYFPHRAIGGAAHQVSHEQKLSNERQEKARILAKFRRWERSGRYKVKVPPKATLQQLRDLEAVAKHEQNSESTVKMLRRGVLFTSGLFERLTKFVPTAGYDLDGFEKTMFLTIDDYDEVLHDVYDENFDGLQMSATKRLMLQFFTQMVMYSITRKMLDDPQVASMMRNPEFVQQMMGGMQQAGGSGAAATAAPATRGEAQPPQQGQRVGRMSGPFGFSGASTTAANSVPRPTSESSSSAAATHMPMVEADGSLLWKGKRLANEHVTSPLRVAIIEAMRSGQSMPISVQGQLDLLIEQHGVLAPNSMRPAPMTRESAIPLRNAMTDTQPRDAPFVPSGKAPVPLVRESRGELLDAMRRREEDELEQKEQEAQSIAESSKPSVAPRKTHSTGGNKLFSIPSGTRGRGRGGRGGRGRGRGRGGSVNSVQKVS
jgi:hypothetical protein